MGVTGDREYWKIRAVESWADPRRGIESPARQFGQCLSYGYRLCARKTSGRGYDQFCMDLCLDEPFASLSKIEDEVKRAIDTLAPGGGFVFFPSHNIQADVTPERLDKVFTAALANRGGRSTD